MYRTGGRQPQFVTRRTNAMKTTEGRSEPVYDGDTGELLVPYNGQPCDPALIEDANDGDTGEPVRMVRVRPLARAA
jgi:hypothetical protein